MRSHLLDQLKGRLTDDVRTRLRSDPDGRYRSPKGRVVPEHRFPTGCLVCGGDMGAVELSDHEAGELIWGYHIEGPAVLLTYGDCGCGNEQRTLVTYY